MTPASYSLLAMLDRWNLMLVTLAGGPLPPLPDAPGRRHLLPWGSGPDPVRQQWELEHGVDGEGDACD